MHHIYLIIHLLSATIWVGGHLILSIAYLPKALKYKDFSYISRFEQVYEPIGMPALLFLVITGVLMASNFGIRLSQWFSFSNPMATGVSLKLILLLTTVCFAVSAQFWVLPRLRKGDNRYLPLMAFHIISVTLIGMTMLVIGSYFREGGISL